MNRNLQRFRAAFVAGSALLAGACVETPQDETVAFAPDTSVSNAAGTADVVSTPEAVRTLVVGGNTTGIRAYANSLEVGMFADVLAKLSVERVEIASDSVEFEALAAWQVQAPEFFEVAAGDSEISLSLGLEFDSGALEHAQVLRWNDETAAWDPAVVVRRDAQEGVLEIAEGGPGLYALVRTEAAFDSRFSSPVWDLTNPAGPILLDRNADQVMFEASVQNKTAPPSLTPRTIPFYVNNVAAIPGETICLNLDGNVFAVPPNAAPYRYRIDLTVDTPSDYDYYYFRSTEADCSVEGSPIYIQRNNNVVNTTTVTLCESRPSDFNESVHRVNIPTTGLVTNLGTQPCASANEIIASVSVRADRVFPAPGDVVCAEVDGQAAAQLTLTNAAIGRYSVYVPVEAPDIAAAVRFYVATGSCAGDFVHALTQGYPASNNSVWVNDASYTSVGRCEFGGDSSDLFHQFSISAGGVTTQGTGSLNCENVCGNGILWEGEQCDDANTDNGDACANDCRFNDQCDTNPCFPGVLCEGDHDGYACGSCPPGMEGDGVTCQDINGCAANPCFAGVDCNDVAAPGDGYTCGACPDGYTGDGENCSDFDACASDPCGENSSCYDDSPPSNGYWCECNAGYVNEGGICVDENGCASNNCFAGVDCIDTPAPGSGFNCGACPAGFEGDGVTCTDINGCAGDPCFPGVICSDVSAPGSGFSCGACPPGTAGNGIECVEIDGCAEAPCFPGVDCTDIDAPGIGRTCGACPAGYTGDGASCEDFDACESASCPMNSTCFDEAAPSLDYNCACNIGYVMDGGSCVEADGCAAIDCGPNSTCTDQPAPATGADCGCQPGYELTGLGCMEIDGCAALTCPENSECFDDAPPSDQANCYCFLGYTPQGESCVPLEVSMPTTLSFVFSADGTVSRSSVSPAPVVDDGSTSAPYTIALPPGLFFAAPVCNVTAAVFGTPMVLSVYAPDENTLQVGCSSLEGSGAVNCYDEEISFNVHCVGPGISYYYFE